MRDPRDVLKGRVEGRINERIWGVQNKIDGTAQGAMNKAVKAVDRVMDGKPPPGGDQKKKKRMSWWPFGGKDEEAGQAPG